MKRTIKYLLVAMAAFALASCEKEKENPILHPSGTPVQFSFTATPTSETTATLKVVADTPVPADVKIALSAGTGNNMPGVTYPTELVIAKGTAEATGTLTVDKDALTPEVKYTAAVAASLAGTTFADVQVFTITVPKPAPVTVDGEVAEWAALPSDYVTEISCPDGAEYAGIKSAKVFYEDKLYVLLELTDDAIAKGVADGKLRAHFYFDGNYDNANGHYGKWVLPAIDCMLEGKLMSGGAWCAMSSPYYQWTGTDPAVWSGGWTAADASPAFEFVADGNFYECAMDYSGYPGGLADAFTIAFDIQDDGYNTLGFLPNAGPEPGPMALVVKNGTEPPAEPTIEIAIDGDFSDWALIEGVSNGAYGMFKAYSDADNLYFYTYRTTDGRYSALWGGSGYIYLGFDLDGNPENGVELNSNGPYDFIGFFYPYGGTAEAPDFIDAPGVEGGWAPEEGYTLANMKCKGVANEKGAYIEYSIPRKDLPTIPGTPITITTWGNKDMNKVQLTCTL